MAKMEKSTYRSKEELCDNLDKTILEFFETLTDLNHHQSVLAQTMKSGFLNLSRARYSMGVKTVNIDQIHEAQMQAHVKVGVAKLNTENMDCSTDMFTLIQCNGEDTEALSNKSLQPEKDENQSVLRKRTIKSETETGDEKEIHEEKHIEEVQSDKGGVEKTKKLRNSLFDPIKWFGVLVPGSLKQSQSEFKKCAELAVTIGNLQTKLENLRKNYEKLLLLKKTEFS